MIVDTIGPLVFLIIALTLVFCAAKLMFRAGQRYQLTLSMIFSMAFAGVGLFGPNFITPYKEMLDSITSLLNSVGASEPSKAVLKRIAAGELPVKVQDAALTVLVKNPTPTLEADLKAAAAAATSESARNALERALTSYQWSVKQAVRSVQDASYERLPTATKEEIVRPLLRIPERDLQMLIPADSDRARIELLRESNRQPLR